MKYNLDCDNYLVYSLTGSSASIARNVIVLEVKVICGQKLIKA